MKFPICKHTSECCYCGETVDWKMHQLNYRNSSDDRSPIINLFECPRCGKYSIFEYRCINVTHGDGYTEYIQLYPTNKFKIKPIKGFPDDLLQIYEEARQVATISLRGAATLLRIILDDLIDKIRPDLKDKKLFDKISTLIASDVPLSLSKAMECIRLFGNAGVHTNEITDLLSEEVVQELFELVNFIVSELIIKPSISVNLYNKLPKHKTRKDLQ